MESKRKKSVVDESIRTMGLVLLFFCVVTSYVVAGDHAMRRKEEVEKANFGGTVSFGGNIGIRIR